MEGDVGGFGVGRGAESGREREFLGVEEGRERGGKWAVWVQKAGIWNVFRKKLP